MLHSNCLDDRVLHDYRFVSWSKCPCWRANGCIRFKHNAYIMLDCVLCVCVCVSVCVCVCVCVYVCVCVCDTCREDRSRRMSPFLSQYCFSFLCWRYGWHSTWLTAGTIFADLRICSILVIVKLDTPIALTRPLPTSSSIAYHSRTLKSHF